MKRFFLSFVFVLLSLNFVWAQDLWSEFEDPGRVVPSDTGSSEAIPENAQLSEPIELILSSSALISSADISSSSFEVGNSIEESSAEASSSSETANSSSSEFLPILEISSSAEMNPRVESSSSQTLPARTDVQSSSESPSSFVEPMANTPIQAQPEVENEGMPTPEQNSGRMPSPGVNHRVYGPQGPKPPYPQPPQEKKPEQKPIVLQSGKDADQNQSEELNRNLLDISASELQTQAPITFAPQMAKVDAGYRSPRTAAFLSLFLPGAGQYYIGGTANTVRGLFYSLTEIATGFSLYYFGVHKFNEARDQYEELAKKFNLQQLEEFHRDLYAEAVDRGIQETADREFFFDREQWCRSLFDRDGDRVSSCKQFDENHLRLVGNSSFEVQNKENYYGFLEDSRWTGGWADAKRESFAPILNGNWDNTGSSENQAAYKTARQDAKDYSDLQPVFLTVLVLNHLISAADALWFANAHNKSLYQTNPLQSSFYLDEEGRFAGGLALEVRF